MSPDLQEDFYTRYPDLFKQKDLLPEQTAMCWGICFNDGWKDILEDLCKKLNLIHTVTGIQIQFNQIKEKFGTLRIHWLTDCQPQNPEHVLWTSIIGSVIHATESDSSTICELCGSVGKLYMDRNQCLCEKHCGGSR